MTRMPRRPSRARHSRWQRACAFGLWLTLLAASLARPAALTAAEPRPLRVMSFNLWHGGDGGRQPLAQSAKVIQAARADVVGLQETEGQPPDGSRPDNGPRIAALLGWHYFDQAERTGIVSRYPIVGQTPKKWGAKIALPGGGHVWLVNAHLAHAPYQPYQLLKIPYADAPFVEDGAAAATAAFQTRHAETVSMLDDIRPALADAVPVFLTGDFNEPSALDWTAAAADAGRCPAAVAWPTTQAVMAAGFVDAYRHVHADPLRSPGYTWTTVTKEDDPNDRHDRIDYVFVGGRGVRIRGAEVVGERPERADIVVAPYPSDHRAVVVAVDLE